MCRSIERCEFESHPEAIDQGKAVSFFHPSYLIPNLIETIPTLRDTKELDVNSNSCGSSMMWSLAASCFPYFPWQPQYRIISTELEILGYQIERLSRGDVGKPEEQQPHVEGNTTLPRKMCSPGSRCWSLPKDRANNLACVPVSLFIVLRWLTAFVWVRKAWWLGMNWTLSLKKYFLMCLFNCDSKRALFPLERRLGTFWQLVRLR